MLGTIYLHLLILCGILFQGIIGTVGDKEIKGSSDFLIRQKRVISYEQDGARIVRIGHTPYIVHIKKTGRIYCVGTVLSHSVVITSAECAEFPASEYTVVSKTASTAHSGITHNVTNINVHKGNVNQRYWDGIALFNVDPTFVYGISIKNIQLYVGPLEPGMVVTVSGWGYNYRDQSTGPGTNNPRQLRSITVPIISHQYCVDTYRNNYPITDRDICTYHPDRHCGHSDRGAPLVIGDLLVGIFLRSGPMGFCYHRDYPEVFALLQHPDYINWIRANI